MTCSTLDICLRWDVTHWNESSYSSLENKYYAIISMSYLFCRVQRKKPIGMGFLNNYFNYSCMYHWMLNSSSLAMTTEVRIGIPKITGTTIIHKSVVNLLEKKNWITIAAKISTERRTAIKRIANLRSISNPMWL